MLVRTAVLKGKDPFQILADLERLDKMEFDVNNTTLTLNEKVLKDKRRKLKETWDRLCRLYVSINLRSFIHLQSLSCIRCSSRTHTQCKDDKDRYMELKRMEAEYDAKRNVLAKQYEAIKSAQEVSLDDIPLPALPMDAEPTGETDELACTSSILKNHRKAPPGCPQGLPPPLYEFETASDEDDNDDDDDEEAVDDEISPEIAAAKRAAALAGGNVEAAAEDMRKMLISRLFPPSSSAKEEQNISFKDLPDTALNKIFSYENMSHHRVFSIAGYCHLLTKTVKHLHKIALKEKELRLLLGSFADQMVDKSDFAFDEKIIDVATGRPLFPPNRNQRCEVFSKGPITDDRLGKIIAAHPEVQYLEANFSESYMDHKIESGQLTPHQVMVRLLKHYHQQVRTLVVRIYAKQDGGIEKKEPDFISIIKLILKPPDRDGNKFLPQLDSLTLEFTGENSSQVLKRYRFSDGFPSDWSTFQQLKIIRIHAYDLSPLFFMSNFYRYASTFDWIGLSQFSSCPSLKLFSDFMQLEEKLKTRTFNMRYGNFEEKLHNDFPNLCSIVVMDSNKKSGWTFDATKHFRELQHVTAYTRHMAHKKPKKIRKINPQPQPVPSVRSLVLHAYVTGLKDRFTLPSLRLGEWYPNLTSVTIHLIFKKYPIRPPVKEIIYEEDWFDLDAHHRGIIVSAGLFERCNRLQHIEFSSKNAIYGHPSKPYWTNLSNRLHEGIVYRREVMPL